MTSRSKVAALFALALLVTGCGSAKNAASTTTPAADATTAASASTAQGAMTAASGSAMKTSATMNCGATKPVWVNMKSKTYHMMGDKYYGKTKHGKYMCASAAKAAGYHKAHMKAMGTMKNDNDGDTH